jgi:hypothetical protein
MAIFRVGAATGCADTAPAASKTKLAETATFAAEKQRDLSHDFTSFPSILLLIIINYSLCLFTYLP